MDEKSIQSLLRKRKKFHNDFETTVLSILGGFGFQKHIKNERSWGRFSGSLLIFEKCDSEQPSIVFAIFFEFEGVHFQP